VISYNIDGSSQNQFFDLLSIIANPEASSAKLKELQSATEENKKYVEAVAPVSDIIALRESLLKQNADAANALDAAKTQAAQIVSDSQTSAAGIVSDAQSQAQAIVSQATAIKEGADALSAQVTTALADAKKAEKEAKAATAAAKAQSDSAAAAQAATEALQAEVSKIKAALLEKTKTFIQDL